MGTIHFVVNNDGITYYKKMRKGLNNTIIAKTNSGEKVVYKLNELDSYRINGKEFQRKYVVHQGFEKVESVFMQKLYTAAGYTLFKKVKSTDDRLKLTDFYVYKGDMQVHQLNKENYKVILSFFFPKYNLMFSK
jgi:hypothetical protein